MRNTKCLLPLIAATALGALAPCAQAQLISGPHEQFVRDSSRGEVQHLGQPIGPAGRAHATPKQTGRVMDLSESALLQPRVAPPGGYPNMSPSIRAQPAPVGMQGGGQRYVDQPINCSGDGWFSNNNSNINPYLVFDDFVADGSPLETVEFYGGVYGGSQSLGAIASIGIEIWGIQAGGACGWTYSSGVNFSSYTVAELAPTFECNVSGLFDAYKFTANLPAPVSLNAGQNYMITIYATLVNPDGSELFVWSDTLSPHHNPATSWNRLDQTYARCGPDQAFRTNPDSGACFAADCSQTCYYSNYFSNSNPYIALDDFTAQSSGDVQRIRMTGGVWDLGNGAGTDFSNISSLYVELYEAVPNGDFPCGNYVGAFLGFFQVALADTNPRFACTDIHGIQHYTFTIEAPPGFNLAAGQRYMLGVYGVPADPNSDNLFCWRATDATYGFTAWQYDLGSGQQALCNDPGYAFCIDPAPPCFADFNGDGLVDTRDVLAFLNAWSSGNLAADMDYNLDTDTRDVLAFLNIWTAGC